MLDHARWCKCTLSLHWVRVMNCVVKVARGCHRDLSGVTPALNTAAVMVTWGWCSDISIQGGNAILLDLLAD